ncbi:glycoside hydrolase family 95 protein [Spirosoma sp.]|uniref:glycoside hydrolase family 95 protein n=1 Tax=Spirosoma sp. TaxID=1899569 RepID=UPI00262BF451|nr:glycoside hydrolase family 95 protein [Spirosoma sp.]MCX6213982.1 glycoside hydrolase family 95 protein [Spirosoma sp.]
MNRLIRLSFFLFISIAHSFGQSPSLTLWYNKPATVWPEALPLGNGYMGAMVFGDPAKEHLQLNEGTLYTGDPASTFRTINVRKDFKQVSTLLADKKYQEAQALIAREWLGRNHQLYQPMSDFWIDMDHRSVPVSAYKRQLDLATATATTQYKTGNTTYTRTYFASYPDHVMVVKLTANGPGKINCTFHLSTPHESSARYAVQGNTLTVRGKVPGFGLRRSFEQVEKAGDQYKYPEVYDKNGQRKPGVENMLYEQTINGLGMAFETRVKAINTGGHIRQDKNSLTVQGASEVVFVLSAATSYNGFDKSPAYEGVAPRSILDQRFRGLERKPYAELYNSHLADYKRLFDRVAIQLAAETSQSQLPTDQRVDLFSNGKDPSFADLYFQYGRYLMIAGSRPGGQPLNLQGIWNDQMVPPWNGGYTININAQMNYWPAELTNLSECQEPFFKAVKELAINGHETARNMYGNDGWVAHHNMDIWRHAEPIDLCNCAFWPMAAGWLTSHFWEKYLFSGDKTFLKNEAFPLLKGAVQFYQGWLMKNEQGYLVTPVGHSPEQNFLYDDKKQATFSPGPTMDMAIVRESFSRYLEACKTLGIDDSFTAGVRQNLAQLLPYQIGKYGQLQEWQDDFEDADVQHRHFSHLYAMHPSNQINGQTTPELTAAVRRVMERRGDGATGWSMGWKVNVWARLLDGDHALGLLTNLFKLITTEKTHMSGGGTYPNLFCAHPPFQIDGNFGATAGIAEMLVQSHAGEIHLLPALPKDWHTGRVKGLKTRGGFTVDMEWKAGKLTKAVVHSALGGNLRIKTNDRMMVQPALSAELSPANPNPLFSFVDAGKPIIKDKTKLGEMSVVKGFIVDMKTEKGRVYEIR